MFDSYKDIALKIWQLNKKQNPEPRYTGVLVMHAMARLAKITRDEELLGELRSMLTPYIKNEIQKSLGVFGERVYRFGGNASAFMVSRGLMPDHENNLLKAAESLCAEQPRRSDGLFEHFRHHDFIWIDTVFGVCPFLLWTGKLYNRQDLIGESVKQMLGHHKNLFDSKHKLYFQAYNFDNTHRLTEGHWSRGEGWGLLALSEILYDLDKNHPAYNELLEAYRDNLEGCFRCQDKFGMWHQSLETESTYAESSGTALILYAIGRGLKNGSVAEKDHDRFMGCYLKGLKALLGYIALDGSVFNACKGCLAPGKGMIEDYANCEWLLNDEHGTGAVLLCLSQAESLCSGLNMIPGVEELLKQEILL